MKRFLLLFLLIPTIASAVTPVARYLDTDCTNAGDGTANSCAGSPGGAGAYKRIDAAVADIVSDYPNFVSSDVQVTLNAKGATADPTGENLNITGITTDTTRYLKIVGDNNTGIWSTSKYRIVAEAYFYNLKLTSNYTRLQYLQIENSKSSSGADAHGIFIDGASHQIDGCILKYSGNSANGARGISEDYYTGSNAMVVTNNIMYGWKLGIRAVTGSSDNILIGNNTIISSLSSSKGIEYRLYGSGATFTMKNNVMDNAGNDYDQDGATATFNHSNNISSDATSPDSSYRSLTCSYVGATDYHITSGDTTCKDAAADLSGNFTNDIDAQTRTGTWDIGADEYIAPTTTTTTIVTTTTTTTTTLPGATTKNQIPLMGVSW